MSEEAPTMESIPENANLMALVWCHHCHGVALNFAFLTEFGHFMQEVGVGPNLMKWINEASVWREFAFLRCSCHLTVERHGGVRSIYGVRTVPDDGMLRYEGDRKINSPRAKRQPPTGQPYLIYSGGQVVLTHDPYPLPTPPPDSASSAGQ